MFKTHQSEIQEWSKESPKNTAKVVKFVLVSIQRNFACVEDICKNKKSISGFTTSTEKGFEYADNHAIEIHALVHGAGSDRDKLLGLTAIHGLGIPKAGFVLQLCTGKGACLDTHNLKKFALEAKHFKLPKSQERRNVIAQTYLDICDKLGGSEYLWNQWCTFIAEVRWPTLWESAEDCSHAHVRCLKNMSW